MPFHPKIDNSGVGGGGGSPNAAYWRAFSVGFAEVSDNSGGADNAEVNLGALLEGSFTIHDAIVSVDTAFGGGIISTLTVALGIAGDPTYTTPYDAIGGTQQLTSNLYLNNNVQPVAFFQADEALTELDAGQLTIWLNIASLPSP